MISSSCTCTPTYAQLHKLRLKFKCKKIIYISIFFYNVKEDQPVHVKEMKLMTMMICVEVNATVRFNFLIKTYWKSVGKLCEGQLNSVRIGVNYCL